jgi:hypothetical protein
VSFVAAKGSSNEVPFDTTLQPNPDFPSALVGRNDQAAFPKVDPDPVRDRLELTLALSNAQFTALRELTAPRKRHSPAMDVAGQPVAVGWRPPPRIHQPDFERLDPRCRGRTQSNTAIEELDDHGKCS